MIKKRIRLTYLFDIYGDLLTERQRTFFILYYEDDLSLGEIANAYDVSRQAVYDILKRSEQSLEQFETKLGIFSRDNNLRTSIREVLSIFKKLENDDLSDEESNEMISDAKNKLYQTWRDLD